MKPLLYSFAAALLFPITLLAQLPSYPTLDSFPSADVNWYNRDITDDFIVGSSVDKAYKALAGKQPKQKIIVAVLDGGIDITHEKLKDQVWVNSMEIPGNGKDDDGNGYVDDVNGWNFLGGPNERNVSTEVLEFVRIVSELDSAFIGYASVDVVPDSLKPRYKMYAKAKNEYNRVRSEFKTTLGRIDTLEIELAYCERIVAKALGKTPNTPAEICALYTEDKTVARARDFLCMRFAQGFTYDGLKAYKSRLRTNLDEVYNVNYKPRKIIGDNVKNINDRSYGNPDVKGPAAGHGTFVAGIIGASRNNPAGMMGIADNVEIMPVRVVPDGDEDDKDVALGIRYAVDNGAKIINMSFGKGYSLRKPFVDSALVYAQSKNVLLVHAAGNSAFDLDDEDNFPTAVINDTLTVKSWLNVGAHYRSADLDFAGIFSNYGRKSVDLFAPGVQLISLAPDNNYSQGDGTSFAAPVVSGIAALIWSYYPELTALQLKEVLTTSVLKQNDLTVYLPTSGEKKKKIKFYKLSNTGGIVNAYEAVKKAELMVRVPTVTPEPEMKKPEPAVEKKKKKKKD
ncbi:MAG: S8 family serine peptidase [Bacteroidota bacterium]